MSSAADPALATGAVDDRNATSADGGARAEAENGGANTGAPLPTDAARSVTAAPDTVLPVREASVPPSTAIAGVAERFARRLAGPDALELIIEVAHDMRSPLGSILFLAERLRSMQSGPLTPVQERQIGLIYSAAFGLSALAGDVIELARGGEGLVHQRPVPFSVADVM